MKKKFIIFKPILIFFFLFLYCNTLFAQLPDGTSATANFLIELIKNLPQENALKFDTSSPDLSVKLSVSVYIVRDSNGNLNVSASAINQSIDIANNYFKYVGINFSVISVTNIDDYNYSYLSVNNPPVEMFTKHSISKTINLYLIESIIKDTIPIYGFTYFPIDTDKNYIFLRKDYLTGNNLTTMLGHYFGLLSTHERGGGIELVDESNCSTKGDLICDTYADPNLLGLVNNQCLYIGTLKDTNNKYFVPSVANDMSNSPDQCRCILTLQQYRRIFFYYKKYRQYLR